jgi:dTDP-glucose 4,6-dehydratase
MRVAITGGCGFLGAHLVEHFLKSTDATIVVLDKLSYASRGLDRMRDIEGLFDGRVRLLGADIAHPLSVGVLRELDLPSLDYVIHAAAETHVDNSIVDPFPFVQSNLVGMHHVLSLLRHPGSAVRRMFHVSTDEVYGPALDGVSYREGDRHAPTNPYAATKSGAESMALAYAHTYGVPITILNAMNFFGERQHPEKFVPKVIQAVLAGDEVVIHAYPDGVRSGSRFYLHCRSFADAILFLMKMPDAPRRVHVSGDREVTNLELAERIAAVVGRPLRHRSVDFHSSRPGHDLRYALDDTLLRSAGWRPPVTFDESLERTVAWYVAHPEWLRW